jgi:NADPH:quinone reductase-like Zn-dependent oxidoreductase
MMRGFEPLQPFFCSTSAGWASVWGVLGLASGGSEMAEMRAVRFHEYGPASGLTVESVDRPEPGDGEVLVRVRAAGVNPIDWKIRAGYLQEFMPLDLPSTPGIDLAGTVESAGADVHDLAAGDAVFGRGSGTYAEFALAASGSLAVKPPRISVEEAATLGVGGVTAWSGLFDTARLDAGQRLLVHGGAGGVGSLVVQLGHWKGAHVIATASDANAGYVRALGADEVLDYRATRFEDVVGDLDVVFDTVGGDVTERSWAVLRPDGILVIIAGMPEPEKAAERGVRTAGVQAAEPISPILDELARLAESGDLRPQVGQLFSLSEAAAAHAASETGHGRGRIVLQVAN